VPPPAEGAPPSAPGFDLGLPPEPAAEAQEDTLPPPAEGVIDLDDEPSEGEKKDDKGPAGADEWTLDVDDSPQ